MIDPISTVVTVALFGTGWLIGRHARLRRTPGQPKPVCMCEHHYGAHDPETGACQVRKTEAFREKAGGSHKDVWVNCPCVRYTGPQPVEQYWVPPTADMTIVTAPRPVERKEE